MMHELSNISLPTSLWVAFEEIAFRFKWVLAILVCLRKAPGPSGTFNSMLDLVCCCLILWSGFPGFLCKSPFSIFMRLTPSLPPILPRPVYPLEDIKTRLHLFCLSRSLFMLLQVYIDTSFRDSSTS